MRVDARLLKYQKAAACRGSPQRRVTRASPIDERRSSRFEAGVTSVEMTIARSGIRHTCAMLLLVSCSNAPVRSYGHSDAPLASPAPATASERAVDTTAPEVPARA